jgi:hypothetical protein
MQLGHRPLKLFVTGISGSGKTLFWSRFVAGAKCQAKFVFDHDGQFAYRLRVTPARTLAELERDAARGWCVFEPSELYPGQTPEAFAFFCDFAFHCAKAMPGKKLFACDELQKLVGCNATIDEFQTVIETGRIYGLDAAMISIAPNAIHNRIRGQATEVVSFLTLEEGALTWLASRGFDPERVRALPRGAYLCRTEMGAESAGRVF